jgi:hypothetical protein
MRSLSFAALACLAALGCGNAATPGVDAQVAPTDAPQAGDTAAAPDVASAPDATAVDDVPAVQDVAATPDVPAMAGEYPEGPYGSREGTVLANLAWEGYVNTTGEQRSTELTFGPTTLQELRGDGRGYALIHLAEFL